MKRLFVSALALAFTLGLAGCSTHNSFVAADDAGPVAAAPNLPSGYKDVGGGVAWKFGTAADKKCSFGSCVIVLVYAYEPCPDGVYVEGDTLNKASKVVYGMTNDVTGGLQGGEKAVAELNILEDDADSVRITDVHCM